MYNFLQNNNNKNIIVIITVLSLISWIGFGFKSAVTIAVLLSAFSILKKDINKFIIFIFIYILVFPKVSLINIPGTYIGIRGEDILIGVLLLVLLYRIIILKEELILKNKLKTIVLLFIVYLFVCMLSTILGYFKGYISSPLLALLFFLRKIEYFSLFIIAIYFLRSIGHKYSVIKILQYTLIFHLFVGVLQYFKIVGGFHLGLYLPDVSARIMSTFSGPYEYAAYLVFVFPLFLDKIIRRDETIRSLIIIVLLFINVYMTQSRVSLIAILVIAFCYLFFKLSLKNKAVLLGSTVVLSILFIQINQNLFPILPERFNTLELAPMIEDATEIFSQGDFENYLENGHSAINDATDFSFSIRMLKWANLMDGVKDNPLFGMGLSVTGEAVDGNYMRYLAESGIIGLLAWFVLIAYILLNASKVLNEYGQLLFFGTVGLLMTALFIDIFESSKIAMMFWFLVGVTFSCGIQNKEVR